MRHTITIINVIDGEEAISVDYTPGAKGGWTALIQAVMDSTLDHKGAIEAFRIALKLKREYEAEQTT